MNDNQREMIRHALGLPNKTNCTNRNHYCISPGCDGYEDWLELVKDGFAIQAVSRDGWSGNFFYVTLTGARWVLLPSEHISREEAREMRERDSAYELYQQKTGGAHASQPQPEA